ncbi:MAG: hypothetical protein HY756_03325 [Nitrospirae bacterium]|nr:hypothetical protein [Nitrospirota bacterium]
MPVEKVDNIFHGIIVKKEQEVNFNSAPRKKFLKHKKEEAKEESEESAEPKHKIDIKV